MRVLAAWRSLLLRVEFLDHFSEKAVFFGEGTIGGFIEFIFTVTFVVSVHFTALDVSDTFSVGEIWVVFHLRGMLAEGRYVGDVADAAGESVMLEGRDWAGGSARAHGGLARV